MKLDHCFSKYLASPVAAPIRAQVFMAMKAASTQLQKLLEEGAAAISAPKILTVSAVAVSSGTRPAMAISTYVAPQSWLLALCTPLQPRGLSPTQAPCILRRAPVLSMSEYSAPLAHSL